jgi:pyruvate formate lyase activating enzyme
VSRIVKIASISTSLIDYPGHPCSLLFTIGCNLRCRYCQNPSLVLPEKYPIPMDISMVLQSLDLRRNSFSPYICISGGEPTIQEDIVDFCRNLKNNGFLIKLDTNGTRPLVIKGLLEYLDYIAMDIKKDPLERPETIKSMNIIRDSGINYHFRTTVVPGIIGKIDLVKISAFLNKKDKYVIQNFSPGDVLDPTLNSIEPYTISELECFRKILSPFCQVEIKQNATPNSKDLYSPSSN